MSCLLPEVSFAAVIEAPKHSQKHKLECSDLATLHYSVILNDGVYKNISLLCSCCNATEDNIKKGQLRVWKTRGKLVISFGFGFLGAVLVFLFWIFFWKKKMECGREKPSEILLFSR